jgi:hypothetical protein
VVEFMSGRKRYVLLGAVRHPWLRHGTYWGTAEYLKYEGLVLLHNEAYFGLARNIWSRRLKH